MKSMWLGMVAAVVIAVGAAVVLGAMDISTAQSFSTPNTRL